MKVIIGQRCLCCTGLTLISHVWFSNTVLATVGLIHETKRQDFLLKMILKLNLYMSKIE